MNLLQVKHLYKAYAAKPVLEDLTFTAANGLTRIKGRSGIGKTTLLRILLGLETPDRGTISGSELRWAAVFQEDRLLGQLDAGGNLRFALGPDYDAARAAALLEELGLGSVENKKVRDYSGGMKRRLALARALLAPCDALALDEPLTGLDAENRDAALHCVLRAAREKIVLLASHDELALSRFPEFSGLRVQELWLREPE